jgi:hypothetical protein
LEDDRATDVPRGGSARVRRKDAKNLGKTGDLDLTPLSQRTVQHRFRDYKTAGFFRSYTVELERPSPAPPPLLFATDHIREKSS